MCAPVKTSSAILFSFLRFSVFQGVFQGVLQGSPNNSTNRIVALGKLARGSVGGSVNLHVQWAEIFKTLGLYKPS